MGRDPAPDPDAHRGQLAACRPPTPRADRPPGPPARRRARRRDDRRLQGANVAPQIQRIGQLDDRVGDELTRTVEGDVPASIDADQLGPKRRHSLRGRQEVGLVAAPADGVDRVVFEEEQAVTDLAASPPVGQIVLELPGGSVGDAAEPLDGQHTAVTQQERAGAVDLPGANE